MIRVVPVCEQSFGANTYLLISDRCALAVDPAVSVRALLEAVNAEDARLEGILLTHGHFDHVLSLDTLRAATHLPAYIHEEDAIMLTDGRKNAFYDFYRQERSFGAAERLLKDGDKIPLGNDEITVFHTPGHTLGSCCYLCGESLITGDTLFSNTIGRCDLWGGSDAQMASSLAFLRTLPKDLTIYPGHGPTASLSDALDEAAYYF